MRRVAVRLPTGPSVAVLVELELRHGAVQLAQPAGLAVRLGFCKLGVDHNVLCAKRGAIAPAQTHAHAAAAACPRKEQGGRGGASEVGGSCEGKIRVCFDHMGQAWTDGKPACRRGRKCMAGQGGRDVRCVGSKEGAVCS